MPNFIPGNIEEGEHLAIRLRSEQFLENPYQLTEFSRPIGAAYALLTQQTARVSPLIDQRGRCVSMTVTYLRTCDSTPLGTVFETSCDLTATQRSGIETVEYSPNITLTDKFQVLDVDCDKNNRYSRAEIIAREQLNVLTKMEADLSARLVAFFSANADTATTALTSTMDTPVEGIVTGTISVLRENFKSEMVADIDYLAGQIDVSNYVILTGKNLYNEAFLSQYKSEACCTNSDILNDSRFRFVFDNRNVDDATGRYTYLIDTSSYSFFSVNKFDNDLPMPKAKDRETYRVALPRLRWNKNGTLAPIYVDVTRQRICLNDHDGWAFKYELSAGLNQTIDKCNGFYGVIKFGTVPVV